MLSVSFSHPSKNMLQTSFIFPQVSRVKFKDYAIQPHPGIYRQVLDTRITEPMDTMKSKCILLVGGFQQISKICSSNWVHLPQISEWTFQKYLSCHQPALGFPTQYVCNPPKKIKGYIACLAESEELDSLAFWLFWLILGLKPNRARSSSVGLSCDAYRNVAILVITYNW